MVAEKTDRQNGRPPFGTVPQTLSTVGRERARRGQRVRGKAQRPRAEIVNRCVSTTPLPINVIEETAMNAMTQPIELALDETGVPEGQILADSIRPWRSDCKAGQFKVGASTMRGKTLDLEIVGAQISEGAYFAYPWQKWLALLFIDPDRVLSSLLFKGESLDNFEELRRQHQLRGETLLGKTLRATMHLRTSRLHGESYYAVEFEVVSDGKYARQIADFRRQHYHPGLFRLLSGPTENGNGQETETASKGKKP